MTRAPSKRPWRFRGIVADAAALGCTRSHLARVLSGERHGKSLMDRYQALKAAQAAAAHTDTTTNQMNLNENC
jgi:hypothetical protein